MKPKVKVIPIDITDADRARLLEKLLEHEWHKYKSVYESLLRLKWSIEHVYQIELNIKWFEEVLEEVMKLEIKSE